ncbi:MAG: hypothetical protein Q8P50_11130 [Bacillota bacterium]|nr:hypothetical protein [Bacillota bacterium]
MRRTGESGTSRSDLGGFLVDDPMSIDPAYFFDAHCRGKLQPGSRRQWLYGEETPLNETWYEDGEELFNMPFARAARGQISAAARPEIIYPYPWLAEPEE